MSFSEESEGEMYRRRAASLGSEVLRLRAEDTGLRARIRAIAEWVEESDIDPPHYSVIAAKLRELLDESVAAERAGR